MRTFTKLCVAVAISCVSAGCGGDSGIQAGMNKPDPTKTGSEGMPASTSTLKSIQKSGSATSGMPASKGMPGIKP